MPASKTPNATPAAPRPLSARETEILGLLAEGMSGATIATSLVLSPETVRTHVRNAMGKLGASTRSQAVAIALEQGSIGEGDRAAEGGAQTAEPAAAGATLTALVSGVAELADVEAAAIYLAEDGGMVLRLAAHAAHERTPSPVPPPEVLLGESGIGKVALERRAQLVAPAADGAAGVGTGAAIAAPMVAGGRMIGVVCIGLRHSRPTSRRELLLLEAFGNRIAEILSAPGNVAAALRQALQRFRASWTGAING